MTARDALGKTSISALDSCYDTETEGAVTSYEFESENKPRPSPHCLAIAVLNYELLS